jgi:uncharacterized membrane protein YecN with MAPEG domain
MPNATVLFASLLTLLYLYLTWQVISRRREYRTPYGYSDQHPDLERAIRAHGNFQEYTPLFLILLCLFEITTEVEWLCYLLGALFLLGRIAHAASLLSVEAKRLKQGERLAVAFRLRFFAMMQTLTSLSVLAVLLLLQVVLHYYE